MRKLLIATLFGASFVMTAQGAAAAEGGVCQTVKPNPTTIIENFHANYLPNLLPAVLNSEKALNLSAEQCQKFNKFKTEKAPNGKKLIAKIIKMEGESRQMALEGADLKTIQARNEEIAALRAKLVTGKMKCHQFVKSVLTPEQYSKLIKEVYPAMRAKAEELVLPKP
ncbi:MULTISPECIES: Spy/CpxP family protein refolding chaperone [Thiomicrorhabdus]|uniref:Spy/CpxP family protein refolding chaperone n=1 Tax=Thiomicrorhabdus heinhorstiae TaxID=2748010 RepID=A0ABS0BYI9_9GAMM|nr:MULTISPECIES: Spy/CpxP family protein refolding chaperone [Thiomicrorhabdus]MBF6058860.1 Spy/CpxP family protein refolding chaperone [Thiomicrorhabdus heinhorstiae]